VTLRERLLALLETGRPVVVDLSETTFVGSSCLGVFVIAFKQASIRGGSGSSAVRRSRRHERSRAWRHRSEPSN